MNFNDGSIIIDQYGLDLSGVIPPLSELPPLPYPTQPSPSGSPTPASCSDPTLVIPYPGVVRFGITGTSYQAYQLTPEQAASFSNRYAFKSMSYFWSFNSPLRILSLVSGQIKYRANLQTGQNQSPSRLALKTHTCIMLYTASGSSRLHLISPRTFK